MTDTLSPEAAPSAAETISGPSKFMDSVKTNIASIGQPPAPTAITPSAPAPAAQPAPAVTPAPASPTPAPAAKPDAVVTPASAPPAVEDDLPEAFSNAKAENWKRARQVIAELKTKESTYAKQLKEKDDEIVKLRTKPSVDPEFQAKLDALQKERDEYSGLVKKVAIEQSPEFQAHFKPKFEHAIATAKAAAGDKAEQIVAIMEAQPGPWRKNALNEIYSSIESEADKYAIANAVMRYDEVRTERNNEIANANTNYEQMKALQAKKAEQREREATEVRQRNLDAAIKKSESVDAFKPIEGNAEHNAMVEANKTLLRKFMTHEGLSIEEYMDAPIQAAEAKRLKVVVDALTKERDDLAKAIAEFKQANPGMRGGQPVNGSVPVERGPYGDSKFMGTFREGMREAGLV